MALNPVVFTEKVVRVTKVGSGGRISNIYFSPSDSILLPLKLEIRRECFRDPVMPSRDSIAADVEPPAHYFFPLFAK